MHRSYQPLKPVTNRYLQRRWDQHDYDSHRKKVRMKTEESGGPCGGRGVQLVARLWFPFLSFSIIATKRTSSFGLQHEECTEADLNTSHDKLKYSLICAGPYITCPGELLPANGGQQRHEDAGSHPAETEKAAGLMRRPSALLNSIISFHVHWRGC